MPSSAVPKERKGCNVVCRNDVQEHAEHSNSGGTVALFVLALFWLCFGFGLTNFVSYSQLFQFGKSLEDLALHFLDAILVQVTAKLSKS